jgi:FimV-like protein
MRTFIISISLLLTFSNSVSAEHTSYQIEKSSIEQKEIKATKKIKKVEELVEQKITTISQQYQERLDLIEQQNQILQTKIEEISSNFDKLQQQNIKNAHEKSDHQHQISTFISSLYPYAQWIKNLDVAELKLLSALVFLLIIWWSFLHYKQSKLEDAKFKSNYDFMCGEDGLNAKLDLARAYIDMSDNESARKVLAEVRGFGNNKQKLEAEELLKKCKRSLDI